eukprot:4959764-Amphidinium_carterae.2
MKHAHTETATPMSLPQIWWLTWCTQQPFNASSSHIMSGNMCNRILADEAPIATWPRNPILSSTLYHLSMATLMGAHDAPHNLLARRKETALDLLICGLITALEALDRLQ